MLGEKVLCTSDATEWRDTLPSRTSVFGGVEYARIREEQTGYTAHLFLLGSDDPLVAYPYFSRPIKTLPFVDGMFLALCDIRTPEYTGPLVLREGMPASELGFAARFSRFCRERRIVAEFAHLHPWVCRAGLLETAGVKFDREIVYVDLTIAEAEIWEDSLTYACRKSVRRADRERITVRQAENARDIGEFHRIYTQTMDRVQASGSYYSPLDFFMAFFERMPDNARYALAERDGQVIAATLYLHDDDSVYSYLGGADYDFQQMRPSNGVIYDTILWGKREGKKRLILGGGYGPNDGVFRFKASFSPLRAKFQVYKRVHLPEEYRSLCRAWSAHYDKDATQGGYFPAYRAPVEGRVSRQR